MSSKLLNFHVVIIQTLIQSYDLGVRVGRQAILLAETHLTWWLKTKTLTGKEIFFLKDTCWLRFLSDESPNMECTVEKIQRDRRLDIDSIMLFGFGLNWQRNMKSLTHKIC